MTNNFIQARNGQFHLNGNKLIMKGFALGSWLNFENFMLRIPGNEKQMRNTFREVYGHENATTFFNDLINQFITEDDFKYMSSIGVNTVRIPINHRHFEDDQHPESYIEDGFIHIDRILGLCKKYGIFAILDMHTSPGGQNPDSHSGSDTGASLFWSDSSLRQRMINLWILIAKRYYNETAIAGYDILNEPCYIASKAAFNDFYDKAISAIRSIDNNHILFLEGDDWAKDFSIFNSLGGPQQAISFHFYPGQHVCIYDSTENRTAEMERKILYFTKLREKTGMPLWVGETGGRFPKDKLTEGLKLISECLKLFEKNDISWTFWTYKDAKSMGLVFPKDDTNWMKLGYDFRSRWQTKEFRSETVSKEFFTFLRKKFCYPIDENDETRLSFRVSSILDELHVKYLVRPKLRTITWELMQMYPESFNFRNCTIWKELEELLKVSMKQ